MAERVTLFTTRPRHAWPQRAARAQLQAGVVRWPTGVLPPSTVVKSARKGKRWAVEIVHTWAAKKRADDLLGHQTLEVQA